MKYCVSGRQNKSFFSEVDEIKMQYRDKDRLINYLKEFPDKTFILHIPKDADDIDWHLFMTYAEEFNFMICLDNLHMAEECVHHNIPFYWSYPVFSWYELNSLIKLNPCYITLAAPLSFSLDKVKQKTDIPLRLCPNLAHDAYIPRENGIYGTWVRPEDVSVYEKYIDVFEFVTDDLGQERTLFHIYHDNMIWPGNLNILFTNFNVNVDNRGIPEEIGEMRSVCGQRCMETGNCHFCETAIKFSNAIRKKHYEDKKITPITPEEDN